MDKVNKIFSILVVALCITLLSGMSVYATGSEIPDEGLDMSEAEVVDIPGSGTEEDPYVLDGSLPRIELVYNKLPFYYEFSNLNTGEYEWKNIRYISAGTKVGNDDIGYYISEGEIRNNNQKYHVGNIYKIDFRQEEKTVIFTKINSVVIDEEGNTNYCVMLPDSELQLNGNSDIGGASDKTQSQLGITYRKESGVGASTPRFLIQEIARTYEEVGAFGTEKEIVVGGNKVKVKEREYSLHNVNANLVAGIQDPMDDMYFFTAAGGDKQDSLFVPLYYRYKTEFDYRYSYGYGPSETNLFFRNKDFDETNTTIKNMNSNDKAIKQSAIYTLLDEDSRSSTFEHMYLNSKPITIMYKFSGYTNTALNLGDEASQDKGTVEAIVTRLLNAIGDLFLWMVQGVFGKDLTIDGLIFNRYEGTKINFYEGTPSKVTTALKDVVNPWYKTFSSFAYVCYVVILVYIGMMIVATSGTDKQSKARQYLSNWFLGLVILFTVPTYILPALIKINDALVMYIGQNTSVIESYYNYYDPEMEKSIFGKADILGGDSSTESIKEIVTSKKEELEGKLQTLQDNKNKALNDIIKNYVKIENGGPSDEYALARLTVTFYDEYVERRNAGEAVSVGLAEKIILEAFYNYNLSRPATQAYTLGITENWEEVSRVLEESIVVEKQIAYTEKLLESAGKPDLMGTMRNLSGTYLRIVFAIIWFMLIFQLLGLAFIYFKRIFIMAILIAIFPIIMIFYCIDKITDGKAQTLSMWFKEILSNIFIQSVHAVIYVVLVETGLKIYMNDNNNWLLLMAAMLMIIPAEKILKDVFGLNGSTLGQLGGMAMKSAMMIGAAKTLLTARMGARDKGLTDKNNKRNARLQKSQDRADKKRATREAKRSAKTGSTKAKGLGKVREGMFHAGTAARKTAAAAMPVASQVARATKNVVATTGGMMYGIANGGEPDSMLAGAVAAKEAIGKSTKKRDENDKIKMRITSAYDRKKNKP